MTNTMPNTNNKIAVIGRPNVGKSSIFNRLVGYKAALVHDQPGITRDRKYAELHIGEETVELIDTAGFEEGDKRTLSRRMNDISTAAMAEAVAVIFVVDGVAGVTPADEGLARLIKQANKPVILVINKADTKAANENMYNFYSLGFEAPILVSAAHNSGFADLAEALKPYAKVTHNVDLEQQEPAPYFDKIIEDEDENIEKPYRPDWLRVAIVGRPNAGKSTLVNQLVGENRMMTGEEAGLTRESNSTRWLHNDLGYELIDTAGLRKKAKIEDVVEKMSASDAIHAVAKAHVVVLLLDANHPFEFQDKNIAAHVVGEGKPLIIALNKWDSVVNRNEILDEMNFMLEKEFSQVKKVPLVTMSALNGQGVEDLMAPIEALYRLWNIRIGAGRLNRFLADAVAGHPPPLTKDHRPVKLKFMAQTGVRPPTFKIWCNRPQAVHVSYLRYLSNGMRQMFGLEGIVFRLITEAGDNPFDRK